jgi:hypothetical protein
MTPRWRLADQGRHGDTMTTMTRTLDYGKGYGGKLGNKCWAARVTGTDNTYGLRREFLEPTKVEREHFNRPRTIIHFSYELEIDGLYELSESGERWFVFVYAGAETGAVKSAKLSDTRVKAWVAALDEGKSGKEARLASKGL